MPDRQLVELLLAGTPYREIVAINERSTGFRVSKAHIANQKPRLMQMYGVVFPRGRRRHELLPWAVRPEHTRHPLVRLLDLEARRRDNLREGAVIHPLTDDLLAELQAFRARLLEAGDLVVHYDAGSAGGFQLVPRRPGIDLDLIRRPTTAELVLARRVAGDPPVRGVRRRARPGRVG
ncbi:MAG: hypothetical protein GEV11_06135 [Streptosporangiales bacterium]|nr:hypothetical protein [Streptosporangiales bacterium]